jgi:hypothetical protein
MGKERAAAKTRPAKGATKGETNIHQYIANNNDCIVVNQHRRVTDAAANRSDDLSDEDDSVSSGAESGDYMYVG